MICECCGQKLKKENRTSPQNKALHKYFSLLAEALNDAGLDMGQVLKKDSMIPWNKDSIKEYLWRPVQKVVVKKESTTELDKIGEIDDIYDVLNRHISEKFGIHVSFPHKNDWSYGD